MPLRRLLPAVVLLASACTFSAQDNGLHSQVHPPFVYQHWQVDHYILKDGSKACAISSGYNGMTVYLRRLPEGEVASVESNRHMQPGDTFTVTVGSTRFQTYNSFFPRPSAQRLVEQFAKGGTAYLEWWVPGGAQGSQRMNVQNVVRLDDFGAQLQQCRDALGLQTR